MLARSVCVLPALFLAATPKLSIIRCDQKLRPGAYFGQVGMELQTTELSAALAARDAVFDSIAV